MEPRFQAKGWSIRKKNTKTLNKHSYSINKLSSKTNIQNNYFFSTLRFNHLPTKTKDIKHHCFLICSHL